MKKKKLNVKNKHIQKRLAENQKIKKKEFKVREYGKWASMF